MSDDPPLDRTALERQARNLEAEVGLRARSDRAWMARRRWLFVRPILLGAAIPGLVALIITAGSWPLAIGPALASALASIPVAWKRPPIPLALAIYAAVMAFFCWYALLGLLLGGGLLLLIAIPAISVPVLVATGLIVAWSAQAVDDH